MKNKSKFSRSELTLRILLFLIFSCSAILKLIVGIENFEMNLMESQLVSTWVQTIYIINITIIAEISCAVIALFGKFGRYQLTFFCLTGLLYLGSLSFNFNTDFYQDYTLIFFGFDIYSGKDIYFFGGYLLNILLLVAVSTLVIMLRKKAKSNLLKWPIQIGFVVILATSFLLLGSFNIKQLKVKTEQYSSGVTNWTTFNTTLKTEIPDFSNGNWTVAFFSVGCDHCKKFARKISFTPGGNKNVLYVFWAEEDEILKFKRDNNIQGPHLKLPQHVIMNIAGQEYPVFFSFSNGTPVMNYTGNEFSYAAIDEVIGN